MPTNAKALEIALAAAPTRAVWVELISRYFNAHELHFGHGTECAEDEAFWLVWELSGNPEDLQAVAVDETAVAVVAEFARRRVEERIPMAYLLGSAWFANLPFEVTPAVLIPRSPLAELVERGLAPWLVAGEGDRWLEIGTGSGCIAIAAAHHNPSITIDATEIDPEALAIANRNRARLGVANRVRLIEADLFPPGNERFGAIISNPPYVPTAVVRALPPEYHHEPVAALDGGEDGLDIVRRLIDGARERLTPDGVLIVEVGLAADALMAAFPRVPWTWLEFERGGDGVFLLTAEELKHGWR